MNGVARRNRGEPDEWFGGDIQCSSSIPSLGASVLMADRRDDVGDVQRRPADTEACGVCRLTAGRRGWRATGPKPVDGEPVAVWKLSAGGQQPPMTQMVA